MHCCICTKSLLFEHASLLLGNFAHDVHFILQLLAKAAVEIWSVKIFQFATIDIIYDSRFKAHVA